MVQASPPAPAAPDIYMLQRKALAAEKRKDWTAAASAWFHCYKAGDPEARLRQADCLSRTGKPGAGVKMALSLLTGEPESDAEVLKRLEIFGRRDIAAGIQQSFKTILAALRAFPGLERERMALAVQFASVAGKIDAQACKLYSSALDTTPAMDERTIITAISRLWMRHGPSEDLLARLRTTLPDPVARGKMELKLLSALGKHAEIIDLLRAQPDLIAECARTPALPAFVLEQPGLVPPGTQREELESARKMFARAARDQKRLWAKLCDPGLSIAVVGNSPVELGKGLGPEIDSHDIVVRFNRFSISTAHAPDYGSKVNVIARPSPGDDDMNLNIKHDHEIIFSGSRFDTLTPNWTAFADLSRRGFSVSWYPQDIVQPLVDRLEARPSSGTYFLQALRAYRKDLRLVDFYGFALTDQIGPDAGPAHYFEKSRPSLPHDWTRERALFDELVAERDRQRAERPAEIATRLRVKIVGDHSAYHCGSAAVMAVMRDRIGKSARIVQDAEDYDVLVINGEGSMHHRSNNYHKKLEAARDAVARGRPWHLINSVWQENGDADRDLLLTAASISLREVLSQQALLRETGISAPVLPDLSYFCEIDSEAPFVDHQGATVATDFYSVEFGNFVRLNDGPISRRPYVEMKKKSWSSLVLELRSAGLLVTGRHHAVYAGCKARLPFVALAGNTHKIEGLIASAGVDIPVCRHPSELPAAMNAAKTNRAAYDALFDWLEAQPRWSAQALGLTSQT